MAGFIKAHGCFTGPAAHPERCRLCYEAQQQAVMKFLAAIGLLRCVVLIKVKPTVRTFSLAPPQRGMRGLGTALGAGESVGGLSVDHAGNAKGTSGAVSFSQPKECPALAPGIADPDTPFEPLPVRLLRS